MSGPQYNAADGDLRLLILTWYRRARLAQLAHAKAASRARRSSFILGVPTVALGAVVGSAIFATINEAPRKEWQVAAGLLSLTSAVLASFQTFLRLDERIREHESAARAFGVIRRELGELGAITQRPRESTVARLEEIRHSYDQTAESTRNVPDRIWDKVAINSETYWPSEFSSWPEVPKHINAFKKRSQEAEAHDHVGG